MRSAKGFTFHFSFYVIITKFQAEKEKYMVEEELGRTRGEKSELDRTLITQNHDVNELRSQVDMLQQALEDKEQLAAKK